MPRESTTTTTKTARTEAATKTSKDGKTKRAPSAYNVFMADNLKKYKTEHEGISHKDAFTAVASLWADADENPNKGKSKADKENKPKKTAGRKKKSTPSGDEKEQSD